MYMKINVSRIPANQNKRSRHQQRFRKLTWNLKMLVDWGLKQQRKRANWGKS